MEDLTSAQHITKTALEEASSKKYFQKISKNVMKYLLNLLAIEDLLIINFLSKRFKSVFSECEIKIFKEFIKLVKSKEMKSSNVHKLLQFKISNIFNNENFNPNEKWNIIENYIAYVINNKHEDFYRLSFNKLSQLKQHYVFYFLKFLASPLCKIRVINIAENELYNNNIERALEIGLSANKSVKKLDLTGIIFDYENALEKLAEGLILNKTLEKIICVKSKSLLGVTHIENLLKGVSLNSSIKEVYLCNFDHGNFKIGQSVSNLLKVNSTIKILSLCNLSLGDAGLSELVKGLYQNKSLERLFLSGNNIKNEGIRDLCLFMKIRYENSLTHLDLSHNSIESNTNDYFNSIAEMIEFNSSLIDLNLKNCNFINEGVKALCNALIINKSLRKLNLYSNTQIDNMGGGFILEMLKSNLNKTLKEVGLYDTAISKKYVMEINNYLNK